MSRLIPNLNEPLGETPKEVYSAFLKNKISDLEAAIESGKSYEEIANGEVIYIESWFDPLVDPYQMLARLYLEYALVSETGDSLLFAYKSLLLDSNISVTDTFTILKDWIEPLRLENLSELEMSELHYHINDLASMYVVQRKQKIVDAMQNFVNYARQNLNDLGEQVITKEEDMLASLKRFDLDAVNEWAQKLKQMSEYDFENEWSRVSDMETDMISFGAEYALIREEYRRNLFRWEQGSRFPVASPSKIDAVFSGDYPSHTRINAEVIGMIEFDRKYSFRFPEMDNVCEAIASEVTKRLSRVLEAYEYKRGYAYETITVPGLGEVQVTLMNGFDDTADIFYHIGSIQGENFELRYSRGTGRTYMNILDNSLVSEVNIHKKASLKNWFRGEEVTIRIDKEWIEKTVSLDEAIEAGKWLEENIYSFIQKMPENNAQQEWPDPKKDMPDWIWPMFIWIPESEAQKIILTEGHDEKLYPNERYAVIPYGRFWMGRDETVHPVSENSLLILGNGKPIPNDHPRNYQVPLSEGPNSTSVTGYRNLLFEVTLQDARHVYIADSSNNRRSHAARTIIPIVDYNGEFEEPVVLLDRTLMLNEVKHVPGVVYQDWHSFE
ncbi:MAG: hypothetical protein NDI94_06120 [Candidatus Woesearchaeota archaeon]|nr:hypothetical protein [Candidatus Woesearchaeota archaeon]